MGLDPLPSLPPSSGEDGQGGVRLLLPLPSPPLQTVAGDGSADLCPLETVISAGQPFSSRGVLPSLLSPADPAFNASFLPLWEVLQAWTQDDPLPASPPYTPPPTQGVLIWKLLPQPLRSTPWKCPLCFSVKSSSEGILFQWDACVSNFGSYSQIPFRGVKPGFNPTSSL